MSLLERMSRLMNLLERTSQLSRRTGAMDRIPLMEAMGPIPRTVETAETEAMAEMETAEMVGTEMAEMAEMAVTSPSQQRASPPFRMPAEGFFPSGLTGCKGVFLTWSKVSSVGEGY